jgi:hypothetical protein
VLQHLQSFLCAPAQSLRSVKKNRITGEAAEKLAKVVLDMPSMHDFGGIPITALRNNKVIDLDLSIKDLGPPEGMVLGGLLPGASSLATLKCAATLPHLLPQTHTPNMEVGYPPVCTCLIWMLSLGICPAAALCSIASNYVGAEAGMKLAEAFAKMPNLREIKCVLISTPMKPLNIRLSRLAPLVCCHCHAALQVTTLVPMMVRRNMQWWQANAS